MGHNLAKMKVGNLKRNAAHIGGYLWELTCSALSLCLSPPAENHSKMSGVCFINNNLFSPRVPMMRTPKGEQVKIKVLDLSRPVEMLIRYLDMVQSTQQRTVCIIICQH